MRACANRLKLYNVMHQFSGVVFSSFVVLCDDRCPICRTRLGVGSRVFSSSSLKLRNGSIVLVMCAQVQDARLLQCTLLTHVFSDRKQLMLHGVGACMCRLKPRKQHVCVMLRLYAKFLFRSTYYDRCSFILHS